MPIPLLPFKNSHRSRALLGLPYEQSVSWAFSRALVAALPRPLSLLPARGRGRSPGLSLSGGPLLEKCNPRTPFEWWLE